MMKQAKLLFLLIAALAFASCGSDEPKYADPEAHAIAVGTGTWGIAAVIPKYLSLRLQLRPTARSIRLPSPCRWASDLRGNGAVFRQFDGLYK